MKIKNILVSQPAPVVAEKSPYHEIIQKYSAKIVFHPFIRIERLSLKEFRSQRIEILDHSAVIFTSRATIDHFFKICEEARITIPETMKYFCNTEAVALYLQKYIVYRKRKIFFANGTFENLIELILKHKEEKFLLTLAEPHKPELPQALQKLKLTYSKVILSRTVSTDLGDVEPKKLDMMVFYSPSEIATLTAAFGTADLPLIATFGEGTARAAIAAGLTVNVMAPTPEAPSMTKAIELFIKKVHGGEMPAPVVLDGKKASDEFIKAQEASLKRARAKKAAAARTAAKAGSRAQSATSACKAAPAGKTTLSKA
ncbi:MAG: uroporphyrinogen-III synthase [Rikenellaceae bacterium]|nr:uroporphyrinogen-III synthase [Rikenellaceae bacterium]